MMQSLEALLQDYQDALHTQQAVIDAFRRRLNAARSALDCKEIQKRNAQLRILYDEKAELQERATQLRNYLKHTGNDK